MANRAKQDVRFRGKTYRPGQILPKSGIKKDPTQGIRDLPPDFGRMLVPQILTFTGRSNFSSHTYRLPDEAIRHSMENARAMRRDCSIMECLEARQRGSALLNWHLEVPDKQDKRQAELLTQMTEIINAIPRFTEYRRNLLEAIWYGRYAIQQSFSFKAIGGHRRCVVKDWLPINGDKLSFRYDDGTGKFKSGQVGVRVGLMNIGDYFNGRKVEYTELGPAYFLEDWERKRIVCHKHMIEDGEYEDVISAGRIHGVGVRDRIYWCWYQKQEAIANLMEVIQRTGTGFTIYWYPFGNPEAKASVEEMALNQGSSNVLLMPRMSGDPSMDAFGVDRIEPSTSGIETLKNIAHEFFGHQIKRYVLGQTLSTEAQATGLGSGVADLHFESFLGIVEYDAKNLEETLTTELIEPLKNINFQWAHGIPVKFRIDTRSADSEKKLNAVRSAWEIGAKIKAADVMDLIGLSMPEGSDDVLVNPTILQQVRLWKKQGEQELGQAGLSGGPYNELQSLFGPLANEVQSGSIPDVTDESDIELGDDEEQVQEPAPQQFAKSHQQRVAAAVKATHSNPSDAQREAGNYAKGTVYLHGLEIAIETPKGAKRNPSWKPLQAHYGYIRRTKGADREPVDCFIGPHPESQVVFVVDMPDKAGRFDEHKALIGWYTVDEARRALAASYHPGWKIGPVTALTVTQFRNWLEKGRTREPIHKQISRYAKRLPSSAGQRDLFSDSITTGKGSSQTLFDQPKKPASSEWTQEDERKHPRGDDGQWISKDEATGELSLKKQPERVEEKPQPEAAAPATTPATKRWLAKQLWNALGGASTYTAADQKFMLGKVEKFLADKPTTAQDVQDSLVNFAWMKGESVTPEGAKRYNELLELIKDKHFVDELPKKSQPEQHRGNPAEPKAKPEVKAQANLFGDEEKPKPSVDLFGNEIKPKFKPAEFDDLGGKQQALFGTAGMPGQMNLFADTGVPDELVNPAMREKAEKQVAAPDPSGRSQAIANGLKKALDYATINSPSQAERVAADVWPTMTSQEQSHFSGYKEFAGAVGKAYQDQRSEAFDPEQAIKIAADSVSALRKQDVYRVLDSNPPERMAEIAAYIKKNRKELTGDVDEALSDIAEERGVPAATPPKASEVILEKAARAMASRSVAAYDHLRESIETLGGVDHKTAEKLADHYISKKLAKLDMVNGSSSVKHGGYLDKSFIENKVNELGLGKTPDDAKPAESVALTPEADPVEPPSQPKTEQAKVPQSRMDIAAEHARRIRAGEATADEVRQMFEDHLNNREAIIGELSKLTVDKLKKMGAGGYRANSMKKAELVNDAYMQIAGQYNVKGGYSYSATIGGGRDDYEKAQIDALRKQVESQTDEHIKAHSEKIKAYEAERQAKIAKINSAIENPVTLEDFKTLAKAKGYDGMTSEQKAKYDDLRATARRESEAQAKSTVAGFSGGTEKTGEIGIVEGHHQKRNQKTWTVTIANHLGDEWGDALIKAKQLGGSYVNARIAKAYKATPGFQFFDQSAANQFASVLRGESADRSDIIEQRQQDKYQTRAGRLRQAADDLHAKAEQELNRDRLTNTVKRARQAASAEATARGMQERAKTMHALADGIESGEIKHLNGIKAQTHLDTLDRTLRNARYASYFANRPEGVSYEEFMAQPETVEDAASVEYPYPKMWPSDLKNAANAVKDVPGVMLAAQRLLKTAGSQGEVKYQTSAGGYKTNGGQVIKAKEGAGEFIHGLKPGQGVRVHESYDWRLMEKAPGHNGPVYTADKGKSWGTTPQAAVLASAKNGSKLDLVDIPEEKMISLTSPSDIEAFQKAASRLKRSANRDLRRVGENLAERIESYNRLQSADIKSTPELRAALREYIGFKAARGKEDPVKKKERELIGRKIPGFFPTPPSLAERMLAVADIQPGHKVLEPSAGKGDLLDAIRERHPDAESSGLEINPSLRELIQAKGHQLSDDRDFLEHSGSYDRIVMNPPFENRQDVAHVQHAYKQLAPGGKIVAIMSSGPFAGSQKRDQDFRDWLDSVGGEVEDNPEGSFAGSDAFRQTGVSTKLVTITKPQTGDSPQQYKRLDSSAGQMDLFGGPVATGRGSTGMLWTEEQEAKHPRDESGKWAPKNEPQQTVAAEPASGFSDDQIRDAIQGTTKLVASLGKKSGVSDNDLDDFVQDVQLKAWQNRQTYSPSQGHFTTWIGNIARHHAFSSHRKNRAKKRGGDTPTESLDAASGDSGSTRASQVADHRVPSADSRMSEIMASIQEMEPRAQKWLTQHYVEGKSQTEIATESGVTKQAVNNVLNRAVDKLRAKLRYRKQTIINAIRKMKSK